ncbi:MAG: TOBE domain-containing protein, partial [Pseudomonadota bacterium]
EVFNAPRTEFVARFIGSHNILSLPEGRYSIRSDRVKIAPDGSAALTGTVSAIEYQGTSVSVTLRAEPANEVTLLLDDDAFFARPLSHGESVGLTWGREDLHALRG